MATKTTTKKAKTTAKKGDKFDKATYLKWYESMLLMRKFEEKAGQLYIQIFSLIACLRTTLNK